jgi:hypothetical protein
MSGNVYSNPAAGGARVVETTTTAVDGGSHIHRRISWAAIFGGVIMIIVTQLLLSMLGAGIGLGTINVNAGGTPNASSFGIGAGNWWVISSIIALCFGGYVAAWFAGIEARFDGVLHGLVAWGIATILVLYLLTSAVGSIIGGGFSALGSVTSAAGSGVKEAAQPLVQSAGVSPDMIQQQAQAYLQPTDPDPTTMSPQDAQKEVARNLMTYAKGDPDAEAAKQQIIRIMAAQMHISQDEATKRFNDAQAKLQQQKDQAAQAAKNAADASASAASTTSFAAFADLLLGAIAAAVGGSLAVQRHLQISQRIVR